MDLETGGLAHQTALEDRLIVTRAVAHKAGVLQQQAVIPGGNHHPAAGHGDICLIQLDAEVHQIVIGGGAGGGDGLAVICQNVACIHAGDQQGRQVLVDDVVHAVAGPLHGGVHQLGVGLGVVHVLDLEIEVLGLVDGQILHGAVQLLRGGQICAGVVADGDGAHLIDVDGVAKGTDLALIVPIHQVGVDVYLVQMLQQSGGPDFGNKVRKCHIDSFLSQFVQR